MKILVVDDELVSRKKMQKLMENIGECEAVESGNGAIASYKKAWEKWAPFDLMTLDIDMPDMSGTEVLSNIREIESRKNIPKEKRIKIIMVTSHSDKNLIMTCIKADCDDYIVKPVDKETIIKKLDKIGLAERLDVSVQEPAQESHLIKEPQE